MSQKPKLPVYVKHRDDGGNITSVLCDSYEMVSRNLRQLRVAGFTAVWIEDVYGRLLAETSFDELAGS
jgi:hypothetical protein